MQCVRAGKQAISGRGHTMCSAHAREQTAVAKQSSVESTAVVSLYCSERLLIDKSFMTSARESLLNAIHSSVAATGDMASSEEDKWDMYALLKHFELVEWELSNMSNLNLETLDMDSCDLSRVPPAITEIEYYAFRDVQAVSFNDNPKITNADILGKLTDLQAINMWRCGLTSIPSNWGGLHKLQVLGLGHSRKLTDFGPIKKLTNITWLDLGGCGLKTLPAEVTHLTKLVVLALGGNEGIEIDDSICCFWNLRKLALNSCALTTVPLPIYSLIKLTHLHLDNNLLQTIEQEIVHLRELEELSVTGNSNLSFPKLLGRCESVHTIVIDDELNLAGISNSLRHKLRIAKEGSNPDK